MCRNGLFPSEQKMLAVTHATGAPRTYFLKDSEEIAACPADTKQCREGYVVPGQEVLTSKVMGKFVCAYFPNKSGGTAGWIAADQLAPSTMLASPASAAWIGKWTDATDEIDIDAAGKAIHASGTATWDGGHGNVNEGSFDASATPAQARASFVDGECTVSTVLVERYLVVTDNTNCGGMNVRFDGVYQRKAAR